MGTLIETQPAGYAQGNDLLGTLGGDSGVQDVFSKISVPGCDGGGATKRAEDEAAEAFARHRRLNCNSQIIQFRKARDMRRRYPRFYRRRPVRRRPPGS